MATPTGKKMLSEELMEPPSLGGQQQIQDVINNLRKKFFEGSDAYAMAKLIPNDSKE